ncbi:glycoside hydrolase family 5 protein [Coniophora puteana RWD-64-598 SS2]|uniref:glucan 1,3-beta-glucosidase n=1 Tax=Coniophora puteana (strain RWD-64-598) TaxID=741705 RepID=A0A5M3N2A1_CONPW|nr:glycoside hydrolase family 5 protein [Coniophora puteana RWD-64-598 SS2]EIW85436.1 glycoside hydrolase family 5 protein [Coniophora puteana RWD-64-598 SS2]
MGHAARDSLFRGSVGSENTYHTSPSAAGSSVYALNPDGGRATPNEYGVYHDNHSAENLDEQAGGVGQTPQRTYLAEKRSAYAAPPRKKRGIIILAAVAGLVVIVLVIALPVYFTTKKKNNDDLSGGASGGSSSGGGGGGNPGSNAVVTGGNGSKVTLANGTTFTYQNDFGGTWYWDQNDPFNNNAQCNSWTPPLNQTFVPGTTRIFGISIGGWLVTEPFIVPSLYEKYINASTVAVDEWTLSTNMRADTSNGGINQLEDHYKTFITEQDFAEMAGAGFNYVRIPLPYWAIEVWDGEPFLEGVAWQYFLKAIQWCRKYGLRINLDFHSLPGSQNGWNHSGKLGSINVLNGPMGVANAQRSLDYIRILAEFISQPEYSDVVTMFSVTNEPAANDFGQDPLERYYVQAYNIVREASGTGAGKGPYIVLHDGFVGLPQWTGFLPNSDRVALDEHPYLCFSTQSDAPITSYTSTPCNAWGSEFNTSNGAFGLTISGEFSNAVTDCGKWVNGVNQGSRYEGDYYQGSWPTIGSCDSWNDWQSWDNATKAGYKQFAMASMDAFQNFFFWTWKIGASSVSGTVEAPQWSYQLGLQNGWLPTDIRQSSGICPNQNIWSPPFQPWQTGGSGAGQIPASATQDLTWPPPTLSNSGFATNAASFPTYTPTGTLTTLPGPTFTTSSGKSQGTASAGDGWANPSDTQKAMTPVSGCSYLDPWVGPTSPPAKCKAGGGGDRRRAYPPTPSPT